MTHARYIEYKYNDTNGYIVYIPSEMISVIQLSFIMTSFISRTAI